MPASFHQTSSAVLTWMTFSPLAKRWLLEQGIGWLVSPFHDNLIVVVGTATILVAGGAASLLSSRREEEAEDPSP